MEQKIKMVFDITLEVGDNEDKPLSKQEVKEEIKAVREYIRDHVKKLETSWVNATTIEEVN